MGRGDRGLGCFEDGALYAWMIRAWTAEGAGAWAEPADVWTVKENQPRDRAPAALRDEQLDEVAGGLVTRGRVSRDKAAKKTQSSSPADRRTARPTSPRIVNIASTGQGRHPPPPCPFPLPSCRGYGFVALSIMLLSSIVLLVAVEAQEGYGTLPQRRRWSSDGRPCLRLLDAGRFRLLGTCATFYRPRRPRESPLFRLVDEFYERVKGCWEGRFERSYGFWRGFVDEVVLAFQSCGSGLPGHGDFEGGFTRVYCDECRSE